MLKLVEYDTRFITLDYFVNVNLASIVTLLRRRYICNTTLVLFVNLTRSVNAVRN